MSDWAIGLSTGCFWHTSLFDCLDDIRDSGFRRLEICSRPGHLDYHNAELVRKAADRIDALGLEAYSFHAPFADHIDITAPDPHAREGAFSEIRKAVEAASLLGARYFVMHPGPENSALPDHERFWRLQNAVGILDQTYALCRRLGVGLLLENMLAHLFAGKVRDLLWLLGALDTTEVGICLDTGHAHLGEDLVTVTHKLSGHLWMVHVSDNNGNRDDHLPPGKGAIDWAAFLAQLRRLHFAGTLMLEITDLDSRKATLDSAREGRRYLRSLSHQLRLPG